MLSILVLALLAVVQAAPPAPVASNYPQADVSGPTPKPEWVATYTKLKAAGKIPNFPPSVLVNGSPQYPPPTTGAANSACSWTTSHCFGPFDVVDAPSSIVGIAFDDGPQVASPQLYDFLKANNQKATHFMIGSRILGLPQTFQSALSNGDHIAVHTWSHPYMTTMTDLQVLGELGWTAQIIYDQSGLVPAFWRPPYGDIDNRVRAIAEQVFGLYSVIWNHDTFDWCLAPGGGSSCVNAGPGTDAGLDQELQGFYNGPKTPGLIILEHELTARSIGGFMRNFPTLLSQGWNPKAIGDIWPVPWYNNAWNSNSPITPNVLVGSGNYNESSNGGGDSIPTTTVAAQSTTQARIATPTGSDLSYIATVTSYVTASPSSASPAPTSATVIAAQSISTSKSSSALHLESLSFLTIVGALLSSLL